MTLANIRVREPDCYLGVVLASKAVDLAAEIEGSIEEVRTRVGDRVGRGEVIATLDTVTLRHQLAIESANLRNAEAQKRRYAIEASQSTQEHQRRLALGGLLSKEEEKAARFRSKTAAAMLEAAEAEVALVEARIEQIETTLARASVQAPFDGTVAQRYLDAGARVSPGMPLVRLISSDSLLARFAVPPEETSRVPVDTVVRVEIETPALALEGVVEQLSPEIDAAAQMVFAEARLTGPFSRQPHIPSGTEAWVSVLSPEAPSSSCLDTP